MNKIVRYKIAIILCFILCVFSLSSCNASKSYKLKEIKDRGYNYYEDIKAILKESKDTKEALDEIETYLTEEKISLYSQNGNIFINFSKSDNDKKDAIIMAILDKEDEKESAKSIATLITIIETNPDKNIRGVITSNSKDTKTGISALEDRELESKEIILLEANDRQRLLVGSVFVDKIGMTKKISSTKPMGELAYSIEIKGFDEVNSGDRLRKHLNPIEYIADFLLKTQNADINIEISSFTNEGNIFEFPKSSKAIVVVEKSSEEKFEERLASAKENFETKMQDEEQKATFTYKKVDLPSTVIDYDISRQLLSAIYTTEDGVYKTEKEDFEGDVIGVFSLAYIHISEDKLELSILSRAADEDTRNEMLDNYKSTAYVLEYEMESENLYEGWLKGEEDTKYWIQSGLAKELSFKGKKSTVDLEENQLSKLSKESQKRKIINVEFDFNDFEEFVYNFGNYLTKK